MPSSLLSRIAQVLNHFAHALPEYRGADRDSKSAGECGRLEKPIVNLLKSMELPLCAAVHWPVPLEARVR